MGDVPSAAVSPHTVRRTPYTVHRLPVRRSHKDPAKPVRRLSNAQPSSTSHSTTLFSFVEKLMPTAIFCLGESR